MPSRIARLLLAGEVARARREIRYARPESTDASERLEVLASIAQSMREALPVPMYLLLHLAS